MTNGTASEERLAEAFVGLADTLVTDYDVLEFMHRLSEHFVTLLHATAAGLLLIDQAGDLQLIAASAEQSRLLELFQLQNDEGPCLDCFRSGAPVTVADLEWADNRWPKFTPRALEAGYRSVHALPMRLRNEVIGTVNLFDTLPGVIAEPTLRIGQALADVATIGILQERALARAEVLAEQLQTALNSRVIIEQAKGLVAARGNVTVSDAFGYLRRYARDHNLGLSPLARAVVDGEFATSKLFVKP